jgi:hypothetical protein
MPKNAGNPHWPLPAGDMSDGGSAHRNTPTQACETRVFCTDRSPRSRRRRSSVAGHTRLAAYNQDNNLRRGASRKRPFVSEKKSPHDSHHVRNTSIPRRGDQAQVFGIFGGGVFRRIVSGHVSCDSIVLGQHREHQWHRRADHCGVVVAFHRVHVCRVWHDVHQKSLNTTQ